MIARVHVLRPDGQAEVVTQGYGGFPVLVGQDHDPFGVHPFQFVPDRLVDRVEQSPLDGIVGDEPLPGREEIARAFLERDVRTVSNRQVFRRIQPVIAGQAGVFHAPGHQVDRVAGWLDVVPVGHEERRRVAGQIVRRSGQSSGDRIVGRDRHLHDGVQQDPVEIEYEHGPVIGGV